MTAVPDGLERCPSCDEYRGACVVDGLLQGAEVRVACLCDGIVCPRCGVNQMHRPISNRYDEQERKVLHVPYFIGWAGCKECRQPLVKNQSWNSLRDGRQSPQ